jgi:hypothetical protein
MGRQIGEQVAQSPANQPQPAPLGAAAEQDLGHGQTDQLDVAELGPAARPPPRPEQLIDHDLECNDEGVEVGVHEASQEVDVAFATPTLGALALLVTTRHLNPIRKQSSSSRRRDRAGYSPVLPARPARLRR